MDFPVENANMIMKHWCFIFWQIRDINSVKGNIRMNGEVEVPV
jgi:hypothetical protein